MSGNQMPPVQFKRVGENLVWLVCERIFRMGVGVVVLGVVARYLGPERFGLLSYAFGLMAIFGAVSTLGMDGIVIRELVRAPEKREAILGTAFALRLCGGVAALACVFVSGFFSRTDAEVVPLALLAALAFLPQSFDVIDLWFQRNIQSKFTVVSKFVAVLLAAAFRLGLVWMKAPLKYFALALVVEALLIAIGLLMMYRRQGSAVSRWRPSREVAVILLRDSWPLILSGFLVAVYFRVEQVLVMNLLGEHAAGIYYAAARVQEVWAFIPGVLLSSIYPLLVNLRQKDGVAYQHRLQALFDLLTGMGLLIAIAVAGLAVWLVPLLYGAKFKETIPILAILAWSAPITFSGAARAQYFLLENFTIYHTVSALIGIAVNVALALWLMPRFGPLGAAIGAVSGYWMSAYATSWIFSSLRPCARWQTKALFVPFRWRALVKTWKDLREH